MALVAVGMALLAGPAMASAVTWKRVATGTGDDITTLSYRPGALWFATGGGRIFARRLNGSFAQQAFFPGRQFFDIAFSPSGAVGLAAADSGHLYRFAAGAWAPVNLAGATVAQDCPFNREPPYPRATPTDNLVAVAWSSETVAWALGSSEGEVLKSVNGGVTWTDVSRLPDGTCRLPHDPSDVAPVPGSATDVYLLDDVGNAYRTADGLATPVQPLARLPLVCTGGLSRMTLDPANPNRIAGVGSDCGYTWGFSRDAGSTSHAVDDGDPTGLRDAAAAAGTFLVVGDRGEIKRTFDGAGFARIPAGGAIRHEGWLSVGMADRLHAAVGGANGVLALSSNVSPRGSLVIRRGGASARRAGRRVTVRVRGRLHPPRGVPAAVACQGQVFLTVKRGRRQLVSRSARIRPDCRFSRTLTLSRRQVGGAHRLTVVVRFGGDRQLGVRRRLLHVRVR
jgi:hypothetical protein